MCQCAVVSGGGEKPNKHGHKVRKGKLKQGKGLGQAISECGVINPLLYVKKKTKWFLLCDLAVCECVSVCVNRSNFICQSNNKALVDVLTHFMAMVLSTALTTQQAGRR